MNDREVREQKRDSAWVKRWVKRMGCALYKPAPKTIELTGPVAVYYGSDALREDPLPYHYFRDWAEARWAMELYLLDLFFHEIEVDSARTQSILERDQGIIPAILKAWSCKIGRRSPRDLEKMAIADRLEEIGEPELGMRVREAT